MELAAPEANNNTTKLSCLSRSTVIDKLSQKSSHLSCHGIHHVTYHIGATRVNAYEHHIGCYANLVANEAQLHFFLLHTGIHIMHAPTSSQAARTGAYQCCCFAAVK